MDAPIRTSFVLPRMLAALLGGYAALVLCPDFGTFAQDPKSGAEAPLPKGFTFRTSKAVRERLLKEGGGTEESEAAVARGLAWLARQQLDDGSWRYDGAKPKEVAAATGMALLSFLAAGETSRPGAKYQKTVTKGLTFLQGLVDANGKVAQASSMYGQGIATIALCEAVGMTSDAGKLRTKAQAAVGYIVKAQATNGSWGYSPGTSGDTCIVGWQVQALRAAALADIKFDKKVLEKASSYLNEAGSDGGSRYGYRDDKQPSNLRSSFGLLCLQYIDKWGPTTPALIKGVDALLNGGMPTEKTLDVYYAYYATQVIHNYGGPAWYMKWNPAMRDVLIGLQSKEADGPKNLGSWDGKLDSNKGGLGIGSECGRLGVTCLSLLTLEVYYRQPKAEKPKTDPAILDKK